MRNLLLIYLLSLCCFLYPLTSVKAKVKTNANNIDLPAITKNNFWTNQAGSIINPEFTYNKAKIFPFAGLSQGAIPPIVIDNSIFILDIKGNLYSLDINDLNNVKWFSPLTNNNYYNNGSVVYAGNNKIICIINNLLYAINAIDGKIIWEVELQNFVRGDPIVDQDNIFALTIDNFLYAFNQKDGSILWTYQGAIPAFKNLNSSSPALDKKNNILVVPFSTGELIAFNSKSGRKIWSSSLEENLMNTPFTDINFTPIINQNIVIAVNKSGEISGFDLNTGKKIWDKQLNIYTISSDVISNLLFCITNSNILYAINSTNGSVIWESNLSQLDIRTKNKRKVFWNQPRFAGNKLWLLSYNNNLLQIDPVNGAVVSTIKLPGDSYHSPVIANSLMYITTQNSGVLVIS